jgi:hypothetical protein
LEARRAEAARESRVSTESWTIDPLMGKELVEVIDRWRKDLAHLRPPLLPRERRGFG